MQEIAPLMNPTILQQAPIVVAFCIFSIILVVTFLNYMGKREKDWREDTAAQRVEWSVQMKKEQEEWRQMLHSQQDEWRMFLSQRNSKTENALGKVADSLEKATGQLRDLGTIVEGMRRVR